MRKHSLLNWSFGPPAAVLIRVSQDLSQLLYTHIHTCTLHIHIHTHLPATLRLTGVTCQKLQWSKVTGSTSAWNKNPITNQPDFLSSALFSITVWNHPDFQVWVAARLSPVPSGQMRALCRAATTAAQPTFPAPFSSSGWTPPIVGPDS